ncbi:hypothetical protein [Roseobacter sp. HKCC-CH-9208]|uniref:hypothetical protein n=1 Tax=Roseobacter sp. HKCC-CH-9208 TaxID=3120339 RepID=UPI0030EDA380
MPEHIHFILRHAAIGAVIAFAFFAMLLGFNLANLRHLVPNSAYGVLAVVMLYIFCTITFGSAQIGYRIMTLSDDDKGDQGRRDRALTPEMQPIPVRIREDKRG